MKSQKEKDAKKDWAIPPVPISKKRSRAKKIIIILSCVVGGIVIIPILLFVFLYLFLNTITEKDNKRDTTWEEAYYVDEFGAPTNEKYLTTEIDGTFSNSATTNSPLKVRINVSKDSTIKIALYEYGSKMVKDQVNSMLVRHNDSVIYRDDYIGISKDGWAYLAYKENKNNICDNRIYIYDGGKFEFVLTERRDYGGVPSTYKFKILDASILDEAFKILNKDEQKEIKKKIYDEE